MTAFLQVFIAVCILISITAIGWTLVLRKRIKGLIDDTPISSLVLASLKPGAEVTQAELAMVEATLHGLAAVVVVANHIEPPEREIREAVIENMSKGVRYLFLISGSNASSELDGYFRDFETAALIAKRRYNLTESPRELADILCLPFDWEDVPYVFYRIKVNESTQVHRTLAFHGISSGSGLAERYKLVSPQLAHSLIKALTSQAPEPIKQAVGEIAADEFASANVVTFQRRG